MFEHFKGDEEFVRKILDYKYQAVDNQRMVLTKFLNPHEQDIVRSVIGHEAEIYEEGGFINAEMKRFIICPSFYEIYPEDFKIKVYSVRYPSKFEHIEHRDLLGALMHLGISRESIGDICKDPLSFACIEENSDYILMNLNKIKRSHIHLDEMDFSTEIKIDYKIKQFVVSSLRLDKIVSSLYGISRQKAVDAINAGFVKVNYKMIEQSNYLCNNNDMISFKHHGRVKLVLTERKTKSSNLVVEGFFYL